MSFHNEMLSLFLELFRKMVLQLLLCLFLNQTYLYFCIHFLSFLWSSFPIFSDQWDPAFSVQITQNHGYVDWEEDKESDQLIFFLGLLSYVFLWQHASV